jgi:thiopurine S-methyltransferase
MDREFWDERWSNRHIAFHLEEVNPILVKNFGNLNLSSNDRIFIPLCGKSKDISWLLSKGYRVVGVEFNESAVSELFEEINLKPIVSVVESFSLYSINNLEIYLGDFFNLTESIIGDVNAVYDRAALVALPKELRKKYASHLKLISKNVKQLLVTYEYDQKLLDGPPFSVLENEVLELYKNSYSVSKLEAIPIPGGLKKKCTASEGVWLLGTVEKL